MRDDHESGEVAVVLTIIDAGGIERAGWRRRAVVALAAIEETSVRGGVR